MSSTARRRRSASRPPAVRSRPPGSPGSRSAAGSAGCNASTASRATTCCPRTSSPPTDGTSRRARPRTPTCSGASAAAAATSASSRRSSTGCTRSARSLAGPIVHPFSAAREDVRLLPRLVQSAPDELFCEFGLGALPDGQRAVSLFIFYNGPAEEGEKRVAPGARVREPARGHDRAADLLRSSAGIRRGLPVRPAQLLEVEQHRKSSTDDAIDTMVVVHGECTVDRADGDHRPVRRRRRPRTERRDRIRAPRRRLRPDHRRDLGRRPSRTRTSSGPSRSGTRCSPYATERRLRELPQRRRRRARPLRLRAPLGAPRRAQAKIRPRQHLPTRTRTSNRSLGGRAAWPEPRR